MLEYDFRRRKNDDEYRFGKPNTKRDSVPCDVFSCPPKSKPDYSDFETIKRPEVPGMEDFIEKYMDDKDKKMLLKK